MVRNWNVQEQCFQIGDQKLTIYVDDIYFLTGLSHRGIYISLYGYKPSGEKPTTYLLQHSFLGSHLKDVWIDIKTIDMLPLRTIDFTIARLCGIVMLHFLIKAQMYIYVECSQPTIFN